MSDQQASFFAAPSSSVSSSPESQSFFHPFITRSFEIIFTQFPITLLWILIVSSLLYFLAMIYRNLRFIFVHWIRTPHDLRKRYGANSWVVITGSSGGIGLGFACEFAKLGFNIVLISRSDEHLQAAKKEVLEYAATAKNNEIQVKTLVMDFSKLECSTVEFWKEKFLKPLEDLDVSVLINNVGMNYTENFENIDEQILLDFISVNCTSQMMATRMLIKKLIGRTHDESNLNEDGERKRSAIISISSVAGQRPLLYLAPYCATKSFNDFFSRSLALEYSTDTAGGGGNDLSSLLMMNADDHADSNKAKSSSRIDVLSCRPGYVVSKMSQLTEAGGFVLDRFECAQGFMSKLGYVTETYGHVKHAFYCLGYQILPEFWLKRIRQRRLEEKKAKILLATKK